MVWLCDIFVAAFLLLSDDSSEANVERIRSRFASFDHQFFRAIDIASRVSTDDSDLAIETARETAWHPGQNFLRAEIRHRHVAQTRDFVRFLPETPAA